MFLHFLGKRISKSAGTYISFNEQFQWICALILTQLIFKNILVKLLEGVEVNTDVLMFFYLSPIRMFHLLLITAKTRFQVSFLCILTLNPFAFEETVASLSVSGSEGKKKTLHFNCAYFMIIFIETFSKTFYLEEASWIRGEMSSKTKELTRMTKNSHQHHMNSCMHTWEQVDAEMRLALEAKKTFFLNHNQTNQIKGGAYPPCGFSLPISGLSFISGPWWGCHVDQPTSYYDNGSRGSTC